MKKKIEPPKSSIGFQILFVILVLAAVFAPKRGNVTPSTTQIHIKSSDQ